MPVVGVSGVFRFVGHLPRERSSAVAGARGRLSKLVAAIETRVTGWNMLSGVPDRRGIGTVPTEGRLGRGEFRRWQRIRPARAGEFGNDLNRRVPVIQ